MDNNQQPTTAGAKAAGSGAAAGPVLTKQPVTCPSCREQFAVALEVRPGFPQQIETRCDCGKIISVTVEA